MPTQAIKIAKREALAHLNEVHETYHRAEMRVRRSRKMRESEKAMALLQYHWDRVSIKLGIKALSMLTDEQVAQLQERTNG